MSFPSSAGQSNVQATVAPFSNSSGIDGVADPDGLAISASVTVTVEAGVPDLVVTTWAGDQLLSQTLVAGQPVDFGTLVITNEGTATAAPFSFEIRLWDAPPTDATSFLLDLGSVPGGLAAGANATLFPDPVIPESVTPGSGYYIGVVLDTQSDVPEGDAGEANNVVFSGPVTVEAPGASLSATVLDAADAGLGNVTVSLFQCQLAGTATGRPGICADSVFVTSGLTDASGAATFAGLDDATIYRMEPSLADASISPAAWTGSAGVSPGAPPTVFYESILDQAQTVIDPDIDLPFVLNSANGYAQLFTAGISGHLVEVQLPVTCQAGSDQLFVEITTVASGAPDAQLAVRGLLPGDLPGSARWDRLLGTIDLGGSVIFDGGGPVLTQGVQYAIRLTTEGTGECSIPPGPPGASGGLAGSSPTGPWFPDDAMPFRTFVR